MAQVPVVLVWELVPMAQVLEVPVVCTVLALVGLLVLLLTSIFMQEVPVLVLEELVLEVPVDSCSTESSSLQEAHTVSLYPVEPQLSSLELPSHRTQAIQEVSSCLMEDLYTLCLLSQLLEVLDLHLAQVVQDLFPHLLVLVDYMVLVLEVQQVHL